MSSLSSRQKHENGKEEVLKRLEEDFEPWEKSRQARFHAGEKSWSALEDVHNDGEKTLPVLYEDDRRWRGEAAKTVLQETQDAGANRQTGRVR